VSASPSTKHTLPFYTSTPQSTLANQQLAYIYAHVCLELSDAHSRSLLLFSLVDTIFARQPCSYCSGPNRKLIFLLLQPQPPPFCVYLSICCFVRFAFKPSGSPLCNFLLHWHLKLLLSLCNPSPTHSITATFDTTSVKGTSLRAKCPKGIVFRQRTYPRDILSPSPLFLLHYIHLSMLAFCSSTKELFDRALVSIFALSFHPHFDPSSSSSSHTCEGEFAGTYRSGLVCLDESVFRQKSYLTGL